MVGDKLPPAGSNVIPKASASSAVFTENIFWSFTSNFSKNPMLVGVNGFNFKAQT